MKEEEKRETNTEANIEAGIEILRERYALAMERIHEIGTESVGGAEFSAYFAATADFLILMEETADFIGKGGLEKATLEELRQRNTALYTDILPDHYERSYANPDYAVQMLGEEFGAMLCFLYRELRSLIPFVYERRLEEIVIRLELFTEVYAAFSYAWQEGAAQRQKAGQAQEGAAQRQKAGQTQEDATQRQEVAQTQGTLQQEAGQAQGTLGLPSPEEIRGTVYWFVSDYAEIAAEEHLRELLVPEGNFAVNLIKTADLSDVRYLFAYGEYISENELETARFLAALPQEKINVMADTYTEGYRIGFEVTNKDLSKKKTVEIRYQLGFERMMRRAVENFEKLGLQVTCHRNATSILYNPSIFKNGYYGGDANRQYDFDHKDDKALFFDKIYKNHKLEVTRTALEKYRRQAGVFAGPAVLETFGERDFEPVNKMSALKMSDDQNRLWVEYRSQSGELQRKYIPDEECSFTIISFPVPEIREAFSEETIRRLGMKNAMECYRSFFEEIIKINTLDYQLYRGIQQCIIDVLNTADHCEIRGMNGNHTDLRVNLWKLAAPEKETIFENCVADVNIPVGEVFTSPVLKGTNGVLHVSRVYLSGLEYRDLELKFEDGMVREYSCKNFDTEEENRRFIRENVLFRHATLPMGEFAIGTNTAAYVAARKYDVQDKLTILIAEKTGPHFAVGDTCYSHSEDVRVFNPDGKEIVARENEVSRLRGKAPEKAYFNCHTDITIPYDELGRLTAVRKDGSRVDIIREGRFVLEGTEELNRAFEE